MKQKSIMLISAFAAVALLLNGCVKAPDNDPSGTEDQTPVFDFATTKTCPISADYKLSGYSIQVEVYDQNPLEETTLTENGQTYTVEEKKAGLEPIFRAITDENGKFSEITNIPTYVKTVYFYTEYMGVPHLMTAEVTAAGISFDLNSAIAKSKSAATKAAQEITHNFPKNMLVLSDWNSDGVPDCLLPQRAVHPSGYMADLNSALPSSTKDQGKLFDYLNKFETNLKIKEKTPLTLVFADGSASMKNSIGYYTYPTNNPPKSADEVTTIIAVANLSYPTRGGLSSGDQLQLKYWNSATNEFEDEFPAETTVGFVVLSNSFKNQGEVQPSWIFYSNAEFNTAESNDNCRQHCITLNDPKNNIITYAFEDKGRSGSITDKYPGGDFHDNIFYIKGMNSGSVETGNMAELPKATVTEPDESGNTINRTGSLAFEDVWPYEGDYDMNDVVVDYNCTLYRNKNNKVVRIVDQFTARNDGGQYVNGFAYQLNVKKDQVKNVLIDPAPATSSIFSVDPKGLELGQTLMTVPVFADIHTAKGKTFTVTIEFAYPQDASKLEPPYNPFIIIHSDKTRGQELHLPNMAPTDLADLSLLGYGDDRSVPESNIYYISKNHKYPFAINIPEKFDFPDEMVRIDKVYSNFQNWVDSEGSDYQNWYKK